MCLCICSAICLAICLVFWLRSGWVGGWVAVCGRVSGRVGRSERAIGFGSGFSREGARLRAFDRAHVARRRGWAAAGWPECANSSAGRRFRWSGPCWCWTRMGGASQPRSDSIQPHSRLAPASSAPPRIPSHTHTTTPPSHPTHAHIIITTTTAPLPQANMQLGMHRVHPRQASVPPTADGESHKRHPSPDSGRH